MQLTTQRIVYCGELTTGMGVPVVYPEVNATEWELHGPPIIRNLTKEKLLYTWTWTKVVEQFVADTQYHELKKRYEALLHMQGQYNTQGAELLQLRTKRDYYHSQLTLTENEKLAVEEKNVRLRDLLKEYQGYLLGRHMTGARHVELTEIIPKELDT